MPQVCNSLETGGLVAVAALYRSTAYTVMSTNSVLQAENRPLLGELPSRHHDALQALIRLAAAIPSVWETPKHVSHHALCTLHALAKTSPLTLEAFGALVALVLTVPSLFCKPAGPARPTHLARQIAIDAFRAEMTKALIVLDVSDCTGQPMEDQEEHKIPADLENLLPFMKELRRNNLRIEDLSAQEVWERLKRQCHTFLRCCCLFFHFLSDIIPPTELTVPEGDTWDVMCGYLNLPATFRELMDTPLARKKAIEWSSFSNKWFRGDMKAEILLDPCEPPRLVPLPDDFSELMNVMSEFSCPNSEREDSKFPTMCLVCGQILCSQSYCCQIEVVIILATFMY